MKLSCRCPPEEHPFMPEIFDSVSFRRRGKPLTWLVAIIGLVLLLFIFSPFGTIAAGERGVQLRFTAVTGKVFGEGLYFRIPLVESVQKVDIKIQTVSYTHLRAHETPEHL